ncbi:hypothetical protein BJ508DRAFT_155711 [Ascobolus immersus RN42]|uniref:BTB domain-containing protein n=1 Tax=Ascobolus immersus RN42 TaxID=1160509 RepID=A0A3N4I164_ASCIM|nr:hypothetical protein BJ508DRAFT_155711 [Ascobolus immersus RN42]
MAANTKHHSFASNFHSDIIRVIVGRETDPNQRKYNLHVDKLTSASEYFAGLIRFNGQEVATKTIRLKDDFDEFLHAFDAFVEFIYTKNYEDTYTTATLAANVVVLSQRLMAAELTEVAILKLGNALSIKQSQDDIVAVIRTIYSGTHRPYADLTPVDVTVVVQLPLRAAPQPTNPAPVQQQQSNMFGAPQNYGHPQNMFGSARPGSYYPETQCLVCGARFQPESSSPSSTECLSCQKVKYAEETGFHKRCYRNCKARKIVATCVAYFLAEYRQSPVFRELLREIGDFTEDLIMASINVPDSAMVVVS